MFLNYLKLSADTNELSRDRLSSPRCDDIYQKTDRLNMRLSHLMRIRKRLAKGHCTFTRTCARAQ